MPWIAQFEQLLAKNNQYENFCEFVAETTASDGYARQWTEIRNDPALAHALLVQGLLKFLPRTHKTLELAAGICAAGRAEEIRARKKSCAGS